jgi:hypothetical protein
MSKTYYTQSTWSLHTALCVIKEAGRDLEDFYCELGVSESYNSAMVLGWLSAVGGQ